MANVVSTYIIPATNYPDVGGLTVRTQTNTEDGSMIVYTNDSDPVRLAITGDGPEWSLDDPKRTATLWNNRTRNSPDGLTPDELEQGFYVSVVPQLNQIRADILNDPSQYESPEIAVVRQQTFFNENIPGVLEPETGRKHQDDGRATRQRTTAQAPSESLSNGTLTPVESKNENPNIRTPSSSAGVGFYRYPLGNIDSLGYDYIRISAHTYKPQGQRESGFGFTGKTVANEALGTPLDHFILPMHPNLATRNSVSYNSNTIEPLAFQGSASVLSLFTGRTKELRESVNAALNAITNQTDAVKAVIAAEGFNQSDRSLLGRATGQIINPNMELLFTGPSLRLFNFKWRLTPRDEPEARVIRSMVKKFKKHMSPQRDGSYYFLKTPNIFKLEYMFNSNTSEDQINDVVSNSGGNHPYLNKFKPCMLFNCEVNFTPDGSYATFDSGSMTAYELELTFQEIQPIYNDDYDDNPDMGY
jgi:hypothetical protein